MFTLEQIQAAHSQVKSGADFPQYVQDLVKLGVTYYETFVSDGHTDYFGKDHFTVSSPRKYEKLALAGKSDGPAFQKKLKEHQQGKTSYLQFCHDCADAGVEKWAVCMVSMTCTYYDQAGNDLLVEKIPQAGNGR